MKNIFVGICINYSTTDTSTTMTSCNEFYEALSKLFGYICLVNTVVDYFNATTLQHVNGIIFVSGLLCAHLSHREDHIIVFGCGLVAGWSHIGGDHLVTYIYNQVVDAPLLLALLALLAVGLVNITELCLKWESKWGGSPLESMVLMGMWGVSLLLCVGILLRSAFLCERDKTERMRLSSIAMEDGAMFFYHLVCDNSRVVALVTCVVTCIVTFIWRCTNYVSRSAKKKLVTGGGTMCGCVVGYLVIIGGLKLGIYIRSRMWG